MSRLGKHAAGLFLEIRIPPEFQGLMRVLGLGIRALGAEMRHQSNVFWLGPIEWLNAPGRCDRTQEWKAASLLRSISPPRAARRGRAVERSGRLVLMHLVNSSVNATEGLLESVRANV
jgi:hypothetical protein